jgi:hypothetical protein
VVDGKCHQPIQQYKIKELILRIEVHFIHLPRALGMGVRASPQLDQTEILSVPPDLTEFFKSERLSNCFANLFEINSREHP